jgi:hypothetical protein
VLILARRHADESERRTNKKLVASLGNDSMGNMQFFTNLQIVPKLCA